MAEKRVHFDGHDAQQRIPYSKTAPGGTKSLPVLFALLYKCAQIMRVFQVLLVSWEREEAVLVALAETADGMRSRIPCAGLSGPVSFPPTATASAGFDGRDCCSKPGRAFHVISGSLNSSTPKVERALSNPGFCRARCSGRQVSLIRMMLICSDFSVKFFAARYGYFEVNLFGGF